MTHFRVFVFAFCFGMWERALIRERTRDGVAYARSQGRVAGRKLKLSIEQAKAARSMVDSGWSVSSVARSFDVSRPTMYRALERA